MTTNPRPVFSSRLLTLFTMMGVAIGLGNVWRFPYMMGQYGGSAFLLIYILCVVFLAIPAIAAEWALGRQLRTGPMEIYKKLHGKRLGNFFGLVLFVTVLVTDSYYVMVIGNVAHSAYFSAFTGFNAESIPEFSSMMNSSLWKLGFGILILGLSLWVLRKGVNKGIERVSGIFIPVFIIAIIFLVGYTLSLDGAIEKLLIFLRPDFSLIGPKELYAAIGQAFFSVGLGGTFFVIYGSYMKSQENLLGDAFITGLADTAAAVLAGLFIIPALLVFGLEMDQGPNLLFSTLPQLFSIMPFGRFIGTLFLFILILVAFLSHLASMEYMIRTLTDLKGIRLSRNQIIWIVGGVLGLLMLPSAIHPSLIGVLDLIFGSGMQVFGSGLAIVTMCLLVGKMSLLKQVFGKKSKSWHQLYFYWTAYVIPAVLGIILFTYIISLFY